MKKMTKNHKLMKKNSQIAKKKSHKLIEKKSQISKKMSEKVRN